jgi:hypothetical protein
MGYSELAVLFFENRKSDAIRGRGCFGFVSNPLFAVEIHPFTTNPEACDSTGVNRGNGAAAFNKSDNIPAKTITPSGWPIRVP